MSRTIAEREVPIRPIYERMTGKQWAERSWRLYDRDPELRKVHEWTWAKLVKPAAKGHERHWLAAQARWQELQREARAVTGTRGGRR